MKGLHWQLGETDIREAEEMADAIALSLQLYASRGYSVYNAVSACVGVLCALAKESGEARYRSLTQAIELLKEQAREWELEGVT